MPSDSRTHEAAAIAPETGRRQRLPRRVRRILWTALALFALIQLVPYGHDHSNPAITGQPAWDSATTRALVGTTCFDCHSNQTNWYWYTNIAPFSWLTQRDVQAGRSSLNFSEWNKPQDGAGDVAGTIRDGSMPPWFYSAVHWSARLSPAEEAQLIAGLQRTLQASPPIPEAERIGARVGWPPPWNPSRSGSSAPACTAPPWPSTWRRAASSR